MYLQICNSQVGVVQKQTANLYVFLRPQLMAAKIISSFYALVMVAVLVGVMVQMASYGPLSPVALFFFSMIGVMVTSAILHPQEFWCLPTGMVFYIALPSMYILLIVYAIFNLNNVSWGTREEPTKKSKKVRNFL
jgi:chitin synthase